ncbi:hypothetical protein BDZ89DRAFT_1065701, partial [Hymenopellis radicata]
MAPKRKSDAAELPARSDAQDAGPSASTSSAKKLRVEDEKENVVEGLAAKAPSAKPTWKDIVLEDEAEGTTPVYDTCDEIRRKIRKLQKEPGFKVTHWLKDIGGINNNSYHRFMKLSGAHSGVENGTYKAAYMYFEKVRLAEGKKKSSKRKDNEWEYPEGIPLKSTHREKYIVRASWFPDSP